MQIACNMHIEIIKVCAIAKILHAINAQQKENITKKEILHCEQQSIEAYDTLNRLTSYRAQSYDQNKLSFDSIAS